MLANGQKKWQNSITAANFTDSASQFGLKCNLNLPLSADADVCQIKSHYPSLEQVHQRYPILR